MAADVAVSLSLLGAGQAPHPVTCGKVARWTRRTAIDKALAQLPIQANR
jgi:hypothetical protein